MKVAYLIGNGFDIAPGLRTRYSDFYRYYVEVKSASGVVNEFKRSLADDSCHFDKWADLELSLGQYMVKIPDLENFDELIGDIKSELSGYLTQVQIEFESKNKRNLDPNLFLSHLLCPENYLRPRDRKSLSDYYAEFSSGGHIYSVINFNYTNIIEQILGLKAKMNGFRNLSNSIVSGGMQRMLSSIYHVHGSVEEDMVLGVNDLAQVSNDKLKGIQFFRNDFIKSECNRAQRHGIEDECMALIEQADVICIFGSSLGKTDQLWWDLIVNQVKNRNCRLVIFLYEEGFSQLNSSHVDRYKNMIINKLFGEESSSDVQDKLLINVKSGLFNFY